MFFFIFLQIVERFEDVLARRQQEALRSIVIQVESDQLSKDAHQYCRQFGDFKNSYAYSFPDNRHFVLIEYENVDAVQETFANAGFRKDVVPWKNRFLSLQHSLLKSGGATNDSELKYSSIFEPSARNIADALQKVDTVDDQMQLLFEKTRLTDLPIRLRFLSALQAQSVLVQFLNHLFPNAVIYPFGSTMNGFGKMGSDLDMALQLKVFDRQADTREDKPLLFSGKQFEISEEAKKIEGKLQTKCVASMIDYFLPGVSHVLALHRARVPIVRYYDTFVQANADLSLNNL